MSGRIRTAGRGRGRRVSSSMGLVRRLVDGAQPRRNAERVARPQEPMLERAPSPVEPLESSDNEMEVVEQGVVAMVGVDRRVPSEEDRAREL